MPPSSSKNSCVAKKSYARLNYFAFSTKRLCTICRCLSGILILPEEIIYYIAGHGQIVTQAWSLAHEGSFLGFIYSGCVAFTRKYRESADRSEIADFFLFGQKNPFGELFSEMTSKGSISFFFLQNLQNLKFGHRAFSGGHEA